MKRCLVGTFALVALLIMGAGCGASEDESPPPGEEGTVKTSKGGKTSGAAGVRLVVNAAPVVVAMQSSTGWITTDAATALTVVAVDRDWDPLRYAWMSGCAGAFDTTTRARVVFRAAPLPETTSSCSFRVVVSDGRGGTATGILAVAARSPAVTVAPSIVLVSQSTQTAAPGEVVLLHAQADAEDAVRWIWSASAGEILGHDDDGSTSDARWKASDNPGRAWVTATATDTHGSGSFEIEVQVSDRPEQ